MLELRHDRNIIRGCLRAATRGLAFALMLVNLTVGSAEEATPAYGPPPDWVQTAEVSTRTHPEASSAKEGVAFALFDTQVNVGTSEVYLRIVKDFLSQTGVQDDAQLTFDFDPSYQDITLHHISLVRGSNAMNRLEKEKVRVMQRERDLEGHIYDGSLTAAVFLEDVRVGDRLDYAFTVRGFNPTMEGLYSGSFYTRWATSVQRRRFRLLMPADRHLAFKSHGANIEPAIRDHAGMREYVWDQLDSTPVNQEDRLPGWYDAFPWVQLSEFRSWEEVSRWALRLYPRRPALSQGLTEKIDGWRKETSRQGLLSAVQFVQDEVRYLGFELGAGSHRPAPPGEIFGRRFGDCKDKTYLLCAILGELGIEAWPVLVHSYNRQELKEWLPSPYAFDHVIAEVQTPGGTILVDPTRSNQQGPVASRFVPDFALGLRVREQTHDLERLPHSKAGWPLLSTREVFDVHGRKEPALLTVHTKAYGSQADRLRSRLRDSTVEKLQTDYLNYYARQYPGVSVIRPLKIIDSSETNMVEVIEYYRITNFWTLSKNETRYVCEFDAQTISDLIWRPDVTLRKMPLGVRHPGHEILRVEVNLPEPWPIEKETNYVTDSAFRFSSKRSYERKRLVLEYEYQSLTNCVDVARIPAHLKNLDDMEGELAYTLYWPNTEAAWTLKNLNWSIWSLGLLYTGLLAVGAGFVYRRTVLEPPRLPPETGTHGDSLEGLGGWLILVGIGVVLNPLTLSKGLLEIYPSYSLSQWHEATSPSGSIYHPLFAPALIFELLGNLTLLVLSILIVFLYFHKSRSFPKFFVLMLVAQVCVLSIDHAMTAMIPSAAPGNSPKDIIQCMVRCVIWIPYMFVSRRVRGTFVN